MHGRWEGELWSHGRHMWSVPAPSTTSVAAPPSSDPVSICSDSFFKDGRKIYVGDCALFKPPQDSPPFVGLIRRLIVGKEDSLRLLVNWLYRPADLKLVKGTLLEAAPNEVFYSFHKDEIPAASLLHPCKVAFLRKGVELPSGISSFVCRRVYDIDKKCLWWLTDKDYINSCLSQEHQEEVDKLLDKTRIEMHGALQSGGRSPKPLNGPSGATQLKPGSDSVQNSSSSLPSQVKSKKREQQGVQSSDSVKRERLSRIDDPDSSRLRPEQILKSEIATITDKGALVDFEGVEKLVQLMQPESADKKIDLACRIMLVDVISSTDKFDCLGRFVQLRGLPVLDEWLQEAHKGKIGDGSPKESDKSVEDFLLALLRALDRLPVNLHALQTCYVGRSVNHLRTHKNSEVQKKARSLVDTWKKRVEAEMNMIDAKSSSSRGGSWPTKSVISEVPHVGSPRVVASSEANVKTPILQPSMSKAQQAKFSTVSTGSTKLLLPASAREAGSSDPLLGAIKEEKSSSSSQSQNNSRACSSDHGKAEACREDARSSTAGSVSLSKNSGGVSCSRKSSNGGLHGSAVSIVQKEVGFGKSGSLNRNLAYEKGSSPTAIASERVSDSMLVDNGSNHRLIVRLPNTVRSVSSDSPEDRKISEKIERHRDRETVEKTNEDSKSTVLVPVNVLKSAKPYDASYSSINALVESCAKISEASLLASAGDDVGMNLLASVAAGEMLRSDISPEGSPESKPRVTAEDSFSGNVDKMNPGYEDGVRIEDQPSVANQHASIEHGSSGESVRAGVEEVSGESDAKLIASSNGDVGRVASIAKAPDSALDVSAASMDAPTGCIDAAEVRSSSVNGNRSFVCADEKATKNNVVVPDSTAANAKTVMQANDDSASCSSSEIQDDKELLHKKTDVAQKSEDATLPIGSCRLEPKANEADDEKAIKYTEQSEKQYADSNSAVSLQKGDCSRENQQNNEVSGKFVQAPADKSSSEFLKFIDGAEAEENASKRNVSSASTSGSDVAVKLEFDLNEVVAVDDSSQADLENNSLASRNYSSVHVPYPFSGAVSTISTTLPASITIAAAAKGPFLPSDSLSRSKVELGWKGSAATSAFRKVVEGSATTVDPLDCLTKKQGQPLFDFDLNVGVEDNASPHAAGNCSGGGLNLDLNTCDESSEIIQPSLSSSVRPSGIPKMPPKPEGLRGFDLNNGPGVDEAGNDSIMPSKSNVPFLGSSVPSFRMNSNMDFGSYTSWCPPNNAYSAIAVPQILPGRGEHGYHPIVPTAATSQRILGPAATSNSFAPTEMYRGGPVLSSSPAVAFPSNTPFQYPAFPFDMKFPISSNTGFVDSCSGGTLCFPPVPSQLVGPSGMAPTPYRPYVMSLPSGTSSVGSDSRKWGAQNLDLNAGPGIVDLERREERLGSGLRPIPLASGSQALSVEEQMKMFQQMTGGGGVVMKRKEPDGGWDGDRISYKHPPWQ